MSDSGASKSRGLDEGLSVFVDSFAGSWSMLGGARLDGRALGLLLIIDEPHLSSAQICELLQASAGAVSVAMRRLVSDGFVQRKTIPGDRNHYFRAEDDVWATFLRKEREYVPLTIQAMRLGLDVLPEEAEQPRKRLSIALAYMTWLRQHQDEVLKDWIEYRDREVLDGTRALDPRSDQ